ncbi:MAG: ZIP family metal transporter [Candidatus Nomurabacteria bacterium]|jgi:zinc and cadmium transporter|nr:ZIP family metal transporter [Candidatus Nomurabacteria bacterium]
MPNIWQVIFFSLIGGVFSLIGGIILLANKKVNKIAAYASAFAAGALLSAAFVDLLPEAIESGSDTHQVMLFTMIGVIAFYLLEGFINWFHRHDDNEKEHSPAIIPMIIIGDTLHNALDGVAIAAGFLISPTSGIIVTLAIATHEIPQEIGDFGILLNHGMSKKKTILVNILSALSSTLVAVVCYIIGDTTNISLAPLMGIIAGFFIYIAASDIIPTLHHERNRKAFVKKTIWLILGAVLVTVAIMTLHGFVE